MIRQEEKRQKEELALIPSENYCSSAVRKALGSILTDKYSEGYPGKRYYQGNRIIDEVESLAINRAKKVFGVAQVNIQPYSGSPANLAILSAVCQPGDRVLSQHLSMGGHLSMGQQASMTSRFFKAFYYGLSKRGQIDWDGLESQVRKQRPKIIFCGGTAFTKVFDFPRFGRLADESGAFFVADISHIAGLVAAGVHPSPARSAHLIMTTTHKTLRGPRGAMIMVTAKGLKKDPELGKKINQAVFPGLQGGPHNNNIAGVAVALNEARAAGFKKYAVQIVKNAKALATSLKRYRFKLIGGGTKNHLIWIDLNNKKIDGWTAAWALEAAGIIANRQTIPFDQRSPYYPSGLRLGTPAITTRGMKEPQMRLIGQWINEGLEAARKMNLEGIGSPDRERDQKARKEFKQAVFENQELRRIKKEVKSLCCQFPLP